MTFRWSLHLKNMTFQYTTTVNFMTFQNGKAKPRLNMRFTHFSRGFVLVYVSFRPYRV